MKIFVVLVERDGRTIKEPGIVETERKRFEYRYAAASIGDVWDVIESVRLDPEAELVGVWLEHPAVDIINSPSTKSAKT